jgi:hypothetical protein
MQRGHLSASKIYTDSPFGLLACIFPQNVSKTAAYLFALVAKLIKVYFNLRSSSNEQVLRFRIGKY